MKKITKEVYLKWYEDMLFWRKFSGRTQAWESFKLDDGFNGAGED